MAWEQMGHYMEAIQRGNPFIMVLDSYRPHYNTGIELAELCVIIKSDYSVKYSAHLIFIIYM